jgi:hypothetical protein
VIRALATLAVLLHACGTTPGPDAAPDAGEVVEDAGEEFYLQVARDLASGGH